MASYLLLVATIIVVCVIGNNISNKIGVPMLLAFLLFGMFFGSDGVVKIAFDNYQFAEQACSIALIFIMFYGGFGTNWDEARPIAKKAIILSSLGTVITAGLVGVFCYFVLKMPGVESFLMGAVISSTDAASVFSILRSKKLNLKYNTASLLEIESGSNDPFSYMLTIIALTIMNGKISVANLAYQVVAQLVYGIAFGFGIAFFTLKFLKKFKIESSGFDSIFIVAVALISYSVPAIIGGNGYLSVYITGIILGNSRMRNKSQLVHFFDGATGLMQILLFFLLGLLSYPSKLLIVALNALLIAVFLTFIARPLTIFLLMSPFRSPINQQLLVAWSGMRGAASVVFAIMVVINPVSTQVDVFHSVFFIVLFSILIQGTLIPWLSRRFNMIDNDSNVMRTFTDYMTEVPVQFIQFTLGDNHPWIGKTLSEVVLPPESLVILIIRGTEKIIPSGATFFQKNDIFVLSGIATDYTNSMILYERRIEKADEWIGKNIMELTLENQLIMLIKRGGHVLIPQGQTRFLEGDMLIMTDKDSLYS